MDTNLAFESDRNFEASVIQQMGVAHMTKAEILREQKRQEKLKAERERLESMKMYEYQYGECGFLCGIDEVGRGPLAGPVVAGAVILSRDC